MPATDDETITELSEFEPTRVDGVGKGANGFPILMLKSVDGEVTETETSVDEVIAELDKADGDDDKRPDCSTCKGTGKIMAGNRKCPTCQGSGVKPQPGDTAKSLAELAARKEAGVAASGADVPVDGTCGHCHGSGQDSTGQCDACGGTGKDADMPAKSELNTVDADGGKITEGAGGRETVDKALTRNVNEFEDKMAAAKAALADLSKKNVDPNVGGGVDRDKLDAGDFAGKNRSFPIVKPGDVSDAASSIGRAGPDNYSSDKLKANIIAIAKRKGASFIAELPKAWTAEKAAGDVFSAPNPALASAASEVNDDGSDDDADALAPGAPGSPDWEAVDAQTATDACMALMAAAELIRTFASRETTEIAMGEGNDIFDAYVATDALMGVSQALGIMSQLAFHEGLEAAKSLPDDESIEKSGRRLAGKTVAALAAARDKAKDLADHIGGVLGNDDPAKKNDAAKAVEIDMDQLSEEIENMTTDELTKVLDAREDKLVGMLADALKGNTAEKAEPADETKDEVTDPAAKAEGETDEPEGAEVVEKTLTAEEIEANEAAAAAKKEAKRLKKAAEQAAENAAVAKAIEEAVAKATSAVDSLKEQLAAAEKATEDRLATVEKMAAPNPIVRTAPTEAQNVAKARDEVELRIATLENEARATSDPAVRSGNREIIKELRAQQADKN